MEDNRIIVSLFRTDGSQHLGLGHIMRCLAFAQGLEKVGTKSVFATRDYDQSIKELIQRYRYNIDIMPKDCSSEDDALLTLESAHRHNAGLIITDLCNTDTLEQLDKYRGYLQELKDSGKFLITIDDINVITFPSDMVVNPNYGAESINYETSKGTRLLLGPSYFIFRQEFIEAARLNREIKRDARNILVTMGGSDPLHLNLKVVRALGKLGKPSNLNLRIVLGIDYTKSKKRELQGILKDFPGTCELIQASDSLASLMLWSDLAITGGGLTKYETAVTGTPSIIISQDSYQADLSSKFAREGSALYLGFVDEVSTEGIAGAVEKLSRNDALRAEMSKRGKRLVDGKGIERIISEIPQGVLS